MFQIKQPNSIAYDWLVCIPKQKWSKQVFSIYYRCDILVNNLSKSFNATILLQRDKLGITMFEWIKTYFMGRFTTRKKNIDDYKGEIMSKPLRRLDIKIKNSVKWISTYVSRLSFQITHIILIDSFVVDLEKHTCSYKFWVLVRIP